VIDPDVALVVLAVLRKRIADADLTLRDEVRDSLRPGETTCVYLDDVEIGTVQYARGSKGRTTAAVTDPLRLLLWARRYAPHLITEHVNVPGQTVLLAAAKTGGWLDCETGELISIDGIRVTDGGDGTATLRVVPNDAAPAVVQRAVAAGLLTQIREITG